MTPATSELAAQLEPGIEPEQYLDVLRTAYAFQYGHGTDEWTADPSMRCLPALVQGRLKLGPDSRILDVGCGAGDDVAYYATFVRTAVGIDIHSLASWQEIERNRGAAVQFHQSDLLSFKTDLTFDVVVDNGCFHHQHPDQYPEYLRRLAGLLAPGGTLVMSTFKSPGRADHVDPHGRLHAYLDDDQLHDLLRSGGFTVVHELDVYRATKRDFYRITFSRPRP